MDDSQPPGRSCAMGENLDGELWQSEAKTQLSPYSPNSESTCQSA